ncbi:MAG: hypothetical protein IH604_03350 [Burkholderiales bacterium]|nr:hypothetical protein [Burkholderiales bacterium]
MSCRTAVSRRFGLTAALLPVLGGVPLCLLTAAGLRVVALAPEDFPAAQELPASTFESRTGDFDAGDPASGAQQAGTLGRDALIALHRAAVGGLYPRASACDCIQRRSDAP